MSLYSKVSCFSRYFFLLSDHQCQRLKTHKYFKAVLVSGINWPCAETMGGGGAVAIIVGVNVKNTFVVFSSPLYLYFIF